MPTTKMEKTPKISVGVAKKLVLQVVEYGLNDDGFTRREVLPVTFENVELVIENAPLLFIVKHTKTHSTIYRSDSIESYEVWWA
jgi:hypothetical protein